MLRKAFTAVKLVSEGAIRSFTAAAKLEPAETCVNGSGSFPDCRPKGSGVLLPFLKGQGG